VSNAALQRLTNAQAALRAALENHDIDALESATLSLNEAVLEVRAAGAWRDRPDLRDDLVLALKAADAVRGHINALSDRNRRQLDRLIALAGAPRAQAYGRNGRLS
jgi:RNase P/RNase MRP subunit p30